LRGAKFVAIALGIPPIMGDLLMAGNDQITAGPGRQVTDDVVSM
jgi:hypothetical protein